MRTTILFLLLFQFQFFTSHAKALSSDSTTTQLSEVIINEKRLQIPFSSQNRNIYVLDRRQIKNLPVQSVNELLTYIAGVDVRQRGPWGTQADISIDGGTFEQATILLNGIKMNDPQSGHNSMNIPVPVNAIERIEVLRGSAARIYGVNSLTGAINIITVNPNEKAIELQVEGGSNFKEDEERENKTYYSQKVQILGNYASEKHNQLLAASIEKGSGHRYNTAFDNKKIFYNGNLNTSSNSALTMMAGYVYNNFGANGYYAAPNDIEAAEITQTAIASLSYDTRVHQNLTIKPQVSYRYSDDDYRFYRHNLSQARNRHYTHSINPEINANYQNAYGVIGFGVEGRFEQINSSNIGDHNRNNLGIYTEFRTDRIEDWEVGLGVYLNYNSAFAWRAYPGLDIGYSFGKGWKAYINSGTGQRIPSFTDLYYDTPGNVGNPDLNPEKAWYAEGGLKYNSDNLWINASYFHRAIDNFIDWVRNDIEEPWKSNNFLENKVNGLTFSSDYQIINNNDWGVSAGINYTYIQARLSKKDGDYSLSKYALENLKHQLVGKVSLRFKTFQLSITERYQDRVTGQKYLIGDARLSYQNSAYSIYMNANNIFDTQYIEVASTPMPGRWMTVGLNLKLQDKN